MRKDNTVGLQQSFIGAQVRPLLEGRRRVASGDADVDQFGLAVGMFAEAADIAGIVLVDLFVLPGLDANVL